MDKELYEKIKGISKKWRETPYPNDVSTIYSQHLMH